MENDRNPKSRDTEGAIAIVGMACVFPEAPDVQTFWRNIVTRVDAIGEPPQAWEADRYLESGRIETSCGGYLRDLFQFNPHEFGIMPNSIDGGEPDQFLALRVARDALADAGYLEGHNHRDTGIILGHSTYLHRGQGVLVQNHIVVDQTLDLLRTMCPSLDDEGLKEVRNALTKSLPACTTDIAPGLVPNVMTGRIANRLDLKGPNYLVDAACSSSLLAVAAAIDELRAGRSDMMLAGGVNASLPPEVSVIFTQLGALSGRGKVRPFETGSDGTLLGEGLGIVALKRLDDALTHDDRIYAVLRGVGQASDGRGKGLLAPSLEGETLAIRRAYDNAGIDPATVSLIEAHGTGIPLGDKTEIAAISNVFGTADADEPALPMGSVKSMISHCIPAAGIAGLIKTALAIHHRVLPPTLCDEVNPELGLRAPLYVNTEASPWVHPSDSPRRAGINSFGFGGINTHAILEQAPSAARPAERCAPWPAELCVFSAGGKAELIDTLEAFSARLAERTDWSLDQVAAALASADTGASQRIGFVTSDCASLSKAIGRAVERLRKNDKDRWSTRDGVAYCAKPRQGQLAFVFPGEGSQYLGMLADLAMVFDDVRGWLDFWAGLYDESPGHRRTDVAFPPPSTLTQERRAELEGRLHGMDVGSEAVFVGAQAIHALLARLGVTADVMLGHSSGESSALAASRAIPWNDPAELAEHVRRLHIVYKQILEDGKIPTGALLTVGALPLAMVQEQIAELAPDVVIAMHNCAEQLVLYGETPAIEALENRLAAEGGICVRLPFDRGYHTPAFTAASEAFRAYYDEIDLQRPAVPMYSCASMAPFPDEIDAVRDLAAGQWSTSVRFKETVERMHADGVTTFVEVGPSGNLTSFINNILPGRDHLALATNLRRRGGVEQFLTALAHLYAEARPVSLQLLFEARSISVIDLQGDRPPTRRGLILDNTMPKIRLSQTDREQLQQLVRAPAPSVDEKDVATPIDNPNSALPTSAPADVMPDYFGLMRAFLDQQSRVVRDWGPVAVDATPERRATSYASAPLLDAIVVQDEQQLVAHSHLSLERHAFLRDHVLSGPVSRDPGLHGLSCVPLMVSLEMMAEACALLAGTSDVHAIENVRTTGWIALDEPELSVEIRARALDSDDQRWTAEIIRGSVTVVSAEFVFGATELHCAPLTLLEEHRPSVWNDDGLYTCGMFHGPLFQSIRHLDGWDHDGIDAQLSEVSVRGFLSEGQSPDLVLNPVLLDAMGQLAAYWIAQFAGVEFNCFPSTIERIELYTDCPEDLPGLQLRARQRPLDSEALDIAAPRAWNFECLDDQGRPLARVTNLQNVYFGVPLRFYEVRRDPLAGWLGAPTTVTGREEVTLWELEMLPETFCGQSEGIFARILAHIYLGVEEREAWNELSQSKNVRRRREWLLGRACIKEAVRYWVYQLTGELLHPSDILVMHDEQGAPYVDGWWRSTVCDAPSVSLSHDSSACLAAVTDPVSRVGVDREMIGRVRKPSLLAQALTETERALLDGLDEARLQEQLLRIWCAKEAAAKFLGVGLQGVPAAFEVQFADPSNHSALVEYADSSVYVDLIRDDASIIALASELQEENK